LANSLVFVQFFCLCLGYACCCCCCSHMLWWWFCLWWWFGCLGLPYSLLSFATGLIFYNMVFACWIVSFVAKLLVSAFDCGLVYSPVVVCCWQ
jgi:hypothetical protein